MRLFLRLIFAFAALAYGAMPINGMAMETVPLSGQHQAMAGMGHDHMHSAAVEPSSTHASKSAGCVDKHGAMGCGHCAACLTLPAVLVGFDAPPVLRGAPLPALGHQLLSQNNLPLLPPPRV